eukprot:Clim_evm37s119 gene=Clim_evmTU37s119
MTSLSPLSARRDKSGGKVAKPYRISEKTLLDAISGLLLDYLPGLARNVGSAAASAYHKVQGAEIQPKVEADPHDEQHRSIPTLEVVLWYRFEELVVKQNGTSMLFLIVGYATGFQIWECDFDGQGFFIEVHSMRSGLVADVTLCQQPHRSLYSQGGANRPDLFAHHRPLIAYALHGKSTIHFRSLKGSSATAAVDLKEVEVDAGVVLHIGSNCRAVMVMTSRNELIAMHPFDLQVIWKIDDIVGLPILDSAVEHTMRCVNLCAPFHTDFQPVANGRARCSGIRAFAVGRRWVAYETRDMPQDEGGAAAFSSDVERERSDSDRLSDNNWKPGRGSISAQQLTGMAAKAARGISSTVLHFSDLGIKQAQYYMRRGSKQDDGTKSGGNDSKSSVDASMESDLEDTEGSAAKTGIVAILDTASGEMIARFQAHRKGVGALEFDPSGRLLFTTSASGRHFHVFSIEPDEQQTLPCNSLPCNVRLMYQLQRGVTPAQVQSISFSPDLRYVAVSTSRGTTHMYCIQPEGGQIDAFAHSELGRTNRNDYAHASAGLEAPRASMITDVGPQARVRFLNLNAEQLQEASKRQGSSTKGKQDVSGVWNYIPAAVWLTRMPNQNNELYLMNAASIRGLVPMYRMSLEPIDAPSSNLFSEGFLSITAQPWRLWDVCRKSDDKEYFVGSRVPAATTNWTYLLKQPKVDLMGHAVSKKTAMDDDNVSIGSTDDVGVPNTNAEGSTSPKSKKKKKKKKGSAKQPSPQSPTHGAIATAEHSPTVGVPVSDAEVPGRYLNRQAQNGRNPSELISQLETQTRALKPRYYWMGPTLSFNVIQDDKNGPKTAEEFIENSYQQSIVGFLAGVSESSKAVPLIPRKRDSTLETDIMSAMQEDMDYTQSKGKSENGASLDDSCSTNGILIDTSMDNDGSLMASPRIGDHSDNAEGEHALTSGQDSEVPCLSSPARINGKHEKND